MIVYATWAVTQAEVEAGVTCTEPPQACNPPNCFEHAVMNGDATQDYVPQTLQTPGINFWVHPGHNAPADEKPHEAVISSFTYEANAPMAAIWVDPLNGDDRTNCGKQEYPCKSLRVAVHTALGSAVDTVRLAAGLYQHECLGEGILIDRSISIVGEKENDCLIDCQFEGRLFKVTSESGSVSSPTPTLSMTNITVVNGISADRGGAAVYVSTGGSLFLRHCHFANNTATKINNTVATPSDSKIQGGGAVFVDLAEGAQLVVAGCRFDNCTVTGRGFASMGGGLCVRLAKAKVAAVGAGVGAGASPHTHGGRWVHIQKSTFEGCAAAFGGGAFVGAGNGVAVDGIAVVIQASVFQHCTAHAGSGGGIAVYFYFRAANVLLSLIACQILGNTAAGKNGYAQGGGVYYKAYQATVNTTVSFTACRIIRNAARGGINGNQGGGFLAYYSQAATNTSVVVANTVIANNTAGDVDTMVGVCSTTPLATCYALGGGMLVGYTGAAVFTNVTIVECTFSGNAALGAPNAQGAGVTLIHIGTATGTSVVISTCKFSDNIATGGEGYATGGAISLQVSGRLVWLAQGVITSICTHMRRDYLARFQFTDD
jgi:hypothetical protein